MVDAEFVSTIKDLISTKFYPRLDAQFHECERIIGQMDFRARMLEALNNGYSSFAICKQDMKIFTRSQQDVLQGTIDCKCNCLDLCNYGFIVMPKMLREYSRLNGIEYVDSYSTRDNQHLSPIY